MTQSNYHKTYEELKGNKHFNQNWFVEDVVEVFKISLN